MAGYPELYDYDNDDEDADELEESNSNDNVGSEDKSNPIEQSQEENKTEDTGSS